MKFWEWQGKEFWTWSLLDGFTAREVWFGYTGEISARQAAERIARTFWSEK